MKVPIINDNNLSSSLKSKISTDESSTMQCTTGIPPHIEAAIVMHEIINLTMQTLEEVKNLASSTCASISDAIGTKNLENS